MRYFLKVLRFSFPVPVVGPTIRVRRKWRSRVKFRQSLGNIFMRLERVPFESGDFVEQVEIGDVEGI